MHTRVHTGTPRHARIGYDRWGVITITALIRYFYGSINPLLFTAANDALVFTAAIDLVLLYTGDLSGVPRPNTI